MITKHRGFSLLATVFLLTANVFAQQKLKEIKIGDKIPDLLIQGIINQKSNKVQLKELYKDGLLIIDFWGTFCVPCIKEMTFLDSLKAAHPGKFNVLMVTTEDENVIKKFLSKTSNKDIRAANLTLATKDTLLRKLFPHNMIPHNIWIDKDGIVKAITGGAEIKTENILNFNDGKNTAALRTKKDNITFDRMKEFHLGDSIFTYRSIITPRINGIGGFGRALTDKGARYFQLNCTITDFYWNAYSNFIPSMRRNLMEVHTRDSLRLFDPSDASLKKSTYKNYEEWEDENTYCYSLTLPSRVADPVLRNYMFNDLERQFKIKARTEIKNIPCMVVTKIKSELLKPVVMGPDSKLEIIEEMNGDKRIKNARIMDILDWWYRKNESFVLPDPFLCEIKPADDIYFDIDLEFSKENIEEGISPEMLYRQLEKYGFLFKKEIRPYSILVLDDLN
ncbi:TlpA disulfide reductase family protein [Pedobacter sp. B4-66]|uniref:TlpA family protein disulfide reductase n=1 Tax=Pedobacter sp. B4-66 TaxID=2817280 RepID=UPI001BD9D975|nr:TlpA disulfide reductase family protein [Pedobacter sp. B4-66]